MSNGATIEERVASLEREVAELKHQKMNSGAESDKRCWVDDVSGSMQEIPVDDFEEFVRLGREARQAIQDPQ